MQSLLLFSGLRVATTTDEESSLQQQRGVQ